MKAKNVMQLKSFHLLDLVLTSKEFTSRNYLFECKTSLERFLSLKKSHHQIYSELLFVFQTM
jgi:hypothetical protein